MVVPSGQRLLDALMQSLSNSPWHSEVKWSFRNVLQVAFGDHLVINRQVSVRGNPKIVIKRAAGITVQVEIRVTREVHRAGLVTTSKELDAKCSLRKDLVSNLYFEFPRISLIAVRRNVPQPHLVIGQRDQVPTP